VTTVITVASLERRGRRTAWLSGSSFGSNPSPPPQRLGALRGLVSFCFKFRRRLSMRSSAASDSALALVDEPELFSTFNDRGSSEANWPLQRYP
jgi:hypothetical protein